MVIKRTQSPDYPSISLKEAVDRCRRLYQQVQTHAAPRHLVAQGLGFNTMHGGAMSAMAALRKYGLLAKQGDTLRITDLAKRVLFPKTEEEKASALQEAALKPALFSELFQTFGATPPSDQLMTNHLIRAGFLSNAAKTAIAAYQSTLPYLQNASLVPDESEDYDQNFEPEDGSEDDEVSLMPPQLTLERPLSAAPGQVALQSLVGVARPVRDGERRLFDYDFEADGGVGVVVRGTVDTEEALDVLGVWIEMKRKEIARKSRKAGSASRIASEQLETPRDDAGQEDEVD